MKALILPLLILTAMLILSLLGGSMIRQSVQQWQDVLALSDALAEQEQWDDAADALTRAHHGFLEKRNLLHIIVEHDLLDDAELLFSAAFAAQDARDVPDFHAALAQLIMTLHHLAEAQELTLANIL